MAGDKARTVAAAGVGVTAGAIAALLLSRKAQAAPGAPGPVALDDAAMQALLGILLNAEQLNLDADNLINAINNLAAGLGVSAPKLDNPVDITAFRILTTALDNPRVLPDRPVPYDMHLVVKATHINTGVIFVAPNRAAVLNPNSSYWLIANEAVEYKIKNANHIWINAPVFGGLGIAGDGVVCTVEQRRV